MGKPMALRLLNAGFTVNVWNRSPKKIPQMTDAGAKACSSIAELVKASNVISHNLISSPSEFLFGANKTLYKADG